MTIRRIVPNIASDNVTAAASFYREVLDLDLLMDQGWIQTFGGDAASSQPQISIASEGGSGTAVPEISVEVDDVDEIHRRCVQQGFAVEYGPVDEPWGVRRFYVRDPFGRLINVLAHN